MAASTIALPLETLSDTHAPPDSSCYIVPERNPLTAYPMTIRQAREQDPIEMGAIGSRGTNIDNSPQLEVQAWNMSSKEEWTAILTCCCCMFMCGWNDATTGPLLPNIQNFYHVNYTVVSMIFVCACVGFITAALLNVWMSDRFGLGKVILLGALSQIVGYSTLVPAPPFPVMCIAHAINGFGNALQNAQANTFISVLPNNTSAKMGLLHAGYGAGAFIAPLVATQFASLPRWSFHYLISLGIALVNAGVLVATFKLKNQNDMLGTHASALDLTVSTNTSGRSKFKQILSSRGIQLTAFFVWVYVGAEVTTGGWIVTFVIEKRGGTSSAGGFFAGLMLGRVGLLWINEKIGEQRVIYLYSLLAIGLEMIIWFVPNLIGNAVAVALVGVLMGDPFYPIVMNITGRTVPKWILTGSIGWIASFGQAGSAVFPFMTGALAQRHGVRVLQPVLVGMLASLIVLWTLVPKDPKRRGD